MARALALAERGRCTAAPNPWVGCVLVRDGEVVGEGFTGAPASRTPRPGRSRGRGDRARGATAYVTLEPCAHTAAPRRAPTR